MTTGTVFKSITHYLNNLKSRFLELFWPSFKGGLTIEGVNKIPAEIQSEFYLKMERKIRSLTRRRNISLVVLLIALFNGAFPLVAAILFYWWYMKNHTLPYLSEDLAKKILKKRDSYSFLKYVKKKKSKHARILDLPYNEVEPKVYNLNKGSMVDYNLKTWHVINKAQIDWSEDSELVYKLSSDDKTSFLHIKYFNKNSFNIWVGEPLNIYIIDEDLDKKLNNDVHPNVLRLNGISFFKENIEDGIWYGSNGLDKSSAIKAWNYIDSDRMSFLKIFQLENLQYKCYKGKYVSEFEFSEILPG